MLIRTLPLRFKLIAAVVVPLAAVAGFLGVEVNQTLDQRADARAQLEEIERFDAVVAYGEAINDEAQVLLNPGTNSAQLTTARTRVDTALATLATPELEMSAQRLERLDAIQQQINDLRTTVGDDPVPFRDVWAEQVSGAMDSDVVSTLNALRSDAISTFEFDRSLIVDPTAARNLNDYQLFERLETNLIRQEIAVIAADLRAGTASRSETNAILGDVLSETDATIGLLREIGSADATRTYDRLAATGSYTRFLDARDAVKADVERGMPAITSLLALDLADANASSQVSRATADASERLQLTADADLAATEYALVQAMAIGGGLLIAVALIVTLLYRAIRRPLVRLTQQSRKVAEVELPEVVRSIRQGDIDSVGEISEMEVRSKDEIGELMTAFNGMHRTAVELAAEQAEARRVVADMFVNLGRRNQKLLNRMLKGLTVLERDEQDPDTLAALYKVDHLATRMRRNAESLLVLAGASHSRSWGHSIPVYDVIQASLAEVENYDRVDVTATDDLIGGDYVADLAHMIAELTENALAFSPPDTRVQIIALHTRRGFAIVVDDSGVGMPPARLAEANQLIAQAAEQDESPSDFLGHFVVGRLAARNGFGVQLAESLAGVSARIVIPDHVLDRTAAPAHAAGPAELVAPAPLEAIPASPARLEPSPPAPVEPAPAIDVRPGTDPAAPLAEPTQPNVLPRRRPAATTPVAGVSEQMLAEPPTGLAAPVAEPDVSRPAPTVASRATPDVHVEAAAEPIVEPQPEPAAAGGVFSARRRTPGANLPASTSNTTTNRTPASTDHDDPAAVRSSLSGFQTGTTRADQEHH